MADLTDKERAEYNALSPILQKKYDFEREIDPMATHAEIMTTIQVGIIVGKQLKKGNRNVNPNDPEFQKIVFKKLRGIIEQFPEVLAKVSNAIDRTIDYLDNLIRKGVEIVVDLAASIWDSFKNCF